MSALATVQAFKENTGNIGRAKVAGSTTIYAGAMVGIKADGYARGFTAGGDFFAGHSLETVDNSSGSDGDKWVSYRRGEYFGTVPVFASATVANIGDRVWAASDNHADLTLTDPTSTATTTDRVGNVAGIDADGNVQIHFKARYTEA